MLSQRSATIATLAALAAAPLAAAEIMQIEFSAALNDSENGIVIDGVSATASIGIAGMITWDTDQAPYSDSGTGHRSWSNISFQAAGGGTVLLETGEVIPVSFAVSNTAQNSHGNRVSAFHSPADNASTLSWIGTGFDFASPCQSNGSISLRMGQLDSMPLASSPLPSTPAEYDMGVYFEQCTFSFNIERPDGSVTSLILNTVVDQNIHFNAPVRITPSVAAAPLPIATLEQASADINADGVIDTADLGILLGQFGSITGCN